MRSMRFVGMSFLSILVLLAVVSPASAEKALTSFLPVADEVFVQKTSDFPGIGNALLIVRLSSAQVEELGKQTGHTTFAVIGEGGAQTILRDDGQGGDAVPGDFLFTGVANIDEADLNERAANDETASQNARGVMPAFSGRVSIGNVEATPFDAAGFAAGQMVPLGDPVVSVSSEIADAEPTGKRAIDGKAVTPGTNTFQDRVLMIVDPSVVQDPARTINPCNGAGTVNGVWTFERLMTEMANQAATGITPPQFVENWLNHWTVPQNINSDNVPSRAVMTGLINEWRAQSGGVDLDLSIAPFRLLAIVSRLDLATTTGGGGGYGSSTGDFLDAGEARFIFGLVRPTGWADPGFVAPAPLGGGCDAQRFSVIFEYRVPKCECEEVRDWAKAWVNLASLPFPSATYNQALQNLTNQFVPAGSDLTKPNDNALGQLRTNEVALTPDWELREFQLTQNPFTFLNQTTVADNARDNANNTVDFTNWVMGPVLNAINTGGLGSPIPPVPLFFSGAAPTNFLGGHATVPSTAFFWNGPGIPNTTNANESRFRASIASCGGCHAGEPLTPFVHVDPATTPGTAPAALSLFLTGVNNVPDPAFGTPQRDFDDLARREVDINQKANMVCSSLHPVNISAVQSSLSLGRLPVNLFEDLEPVPVDKQLSVAADMLDSPAISEVH